MKKYILTILVALFSLAFASAVCNLDATLVNQDPYPAVPGDYLKLVFQLTGVDNPECGTVSFELLEKYPIFFDPEEPRKIQISAGTYQRDYSSYLMAPYKIRIDEDTLDGENQIEVKFGKVGVDSSQELKTFYFEVEDLRADFEIHIDKYSFTTKELTLEILNIAKSDIEALTIEIPKQDNIEISGSNRVVVGDLDSNEYTTADFKADIEDGEISIKILYTDQSGARRELTKSINFDSSYFAATGDAQSLSTVYYIIGLVLLALVIWWFWRKRKKRHVANHEHHMKRRGHARL